MAKSDLLKQAIADAKAVKETALANAKLALQEAFMPQMKSMLETQLMSELEGEEEMEAGAEDMAMGADEMEAGADDMGMGMPDSVNIGLDFDNDGEYDLTGMIGGEPEAEAEMPAEDEYAAEEEDELNLESIIAELEAMGSEENLEDVEPASVDEGDYGKYEKTVDEDIDSLIEAILAEEGEEDMGAPAEDEETVEEGKYKKMEEDLQEAYRTVKQLQSVINEVNLLNAKLLYTNKLFRNFELNEAQKMKVIENFDRAATTREAKLVFATLAESFNKPTKARKVVKESKSYASRPVASTAPKTQILNEGFEYANRWKKLAGLI
jgi:hypothetical protein